MSQELLDDLNHSPKIPTNYAPIYKRMIALLIDTIIVTAIHGFFCINLLNLKDGDWEWWILFILFILIYFSYFESSTQQASLGKRYLKIKVYALSGRPIHLGQAILRQFGKLFSYILGLLSLLILRYSNKQQAVHDFIARTIVINESEEHN